MRAVLPQSNVAMRLLKSPRHPERSIYLKNEDAVGPYEGQENRDRREDVAECQPLLGQSGLHSGRSNLTTKLQGSMRSEEVVMASEQFEMRSRCPVNLLLTGSMRVVYLISRTPLGPANVVCLFCV